MTYSKLRQGLMISSIALLASAMMALPLNAAAPANDEAGLAALDASLPGDLVNDPRALVVMGNNESGAKSKVIKSDKIPGGGAALQVQVASVPADAWRVSAAMLVKKSINRGDVVTVGFYARALPDKDGKASGKIGVRLQQNVSPWSGFLDNIVDVGPDWQWFEKAGVATVAMQGGAASVNLFLGGKVQNVEIGQLIVVKGANAIAAAAPKPPVVMPPALEKVAGKLINQPDGGPWNFFGAGGTQQRMDDKTIYMGKASRITVTEAGPEAWKLATAIPIQGGIKAGDKLLVAIAAKTISSSSADGRAKVGLRVQSMKPPYDGFADNAISPGPNWQLLQMRTTATIDIAEGDAGLGLMFAGQKQVVDIGPVYIFKLAQ